MLVTPEKAITTVPMLVTLLGRVMLVSAAQVLNAALPILVTLLGIVTLVKKVWEKNALSPIFTTG